MKKKYITLAVLLVVLAAICVWALQYFSYKPPKPAEMPHTEPVTTAAPAASVASSSLGSTIYQNASNPIQDKLPDTNPVNAQKLNPFQNGYQNPF